MTTEQLNSPSPAASGLDVHVRGSGPALLLAHGAGGGIEGNFGLVLDDLARDHTLIGPHYPGAGRTPVSAVPLELDGLADLLVGAATAEGHERFAVLGESLGAAVAVRAAVRHPERVTALVLTVGFPVADPVLGLAARLVPLLARAGELDAVAHLATAGVMTDAQLEGVSPEEFDALVAGTRAGLPPGMADHFDLVARADVRDDLARVRVPSLVFAATGDRLVLPASHRRLAAGIPGARLVELPGAAHVLGGPDRAAWLRHVRTFLAELEQPERAPRTH